VDLSKISSAALQICCSVQPWTELFHACGIATNIFLLLRRNKNKILEGDMLLRSVDDLSTHEQYENLGDCHPDFKYKL
jgi:hypothetical protein